MKFGPVLACLSAKLRYLYAVDLMIQMLFMLCMVSVFGLLQDEIVAEIEDRIAAWTFLPIGTLIPFWLTIENLFQCF